MTAPVTAPAKVNLVKFAWLSVATSVVVIGLKLAAWWVTGSVGLLSDAAESVVNLVAACVAVYALTVAARPADDNHHFGHTKAEYFSAAVEGAMIFVAAAFIVWSAIPRLLDPQPIESAGIGLAISVLASVLNGVVAMVLLRAGRAHGSITLVADGKHLMTDVWTSVGVLVAVGLVALTGWNVLDPVIAVLVALNILWTGYRLVKESTDGLMDISLPKEENEALEAVLNRHRSDSIEFHAVRTRESGRRRFMEVHVLVPGAWTVQAGHEFVERVEAELREVVPGINISAHLEPVEDPASYADTELHGD